MRRVAFVSSLIVSIFSLLPSAPAAADHGNPCDPSGPTCTRVACPPPQRGNGWIWIDHHGFPHADFTDCAAT